MEILGVRIGRSNVEVAADRELKSVKDAINAQAEALCEAMEKVIPQLDVPLIFEPDDKWSYGGLVKRSFDVSDTEFSNEVTVKSTPPEYNIVRGVTYRTMVEGQDFMFHLWIKRTETENSLSFNLGGWTVGFKGNELSSEKVTREQLATLKGFHSIVNALVAQTHLWQAKNEVRNATDQLDHTEFGPEAKAVLEVASAK